MRSSLLGAAAALVLVNALHGADHVRQGVDRLTTEVTVGGQALLILALVPFALALRRHRLAPHVAAATGLWTALAVAASHLLPRWSAFSDPYADNDLDALAWVSMLALLIAALALGVVGIRALYSRSVSRVSTTGRPDASRTAEPR